MADLSTKKYIDEEALKALIKNIKTADAAVLSDAKTYVGTYDEEFDDAISYLESLIGDSSSDGVVSIEEISTGLADNVLKSYVFYQGLSGEETAEQKEAKKIGTINLAKDLVVTAGEVVKLAAEEVEGLVAGTYLKLTIANQTAPVYINVLDLVNDFTVEENAASVQLAISETRQISASIKDGSISRDKIDEDFEAAMAAIEAAIGSDDDGLVAVTDRIQAEAANATYKAATEDTEAVTIAGAIAALESAVGEGGAVSDQIEAALAELKLEEVGGEGKLITTISQEDGQVSATAIDITSITGDLTKAGEEDTDPVARTVKQYVDDSIKELDDNYVAITAEEVNKLFTETTTDDVVTP